MYPFLKIGNMTLPMYGVCIATGVLISVLVAAIDCRRKGLYWEYMLAMAAPGLLAGLVGAKLLFCLVTYTPQDFLAILAAGDFKRLISGGYVYYGGLTLGILTAFGMSKFIKCRLQDYENTLVKCIPLAHAFGRIGCFFAGCCFGCPTDSGIGIVFKNPLGAAPTGIPLLPVQLFESALNLLLTAFLWYLDNKNPKKRILLPVYLMLYATERFIVEYFRYDAMRGFYGGISTSQWISIGIFVTGFSILIYRKEKTAKF